MHSLVWVLIFDVISNIEPFSVVIKFIPAIKRKPRAAVFGLGRFRVRVAIKKDRLARRVRFAFQSRQRTTTVDRSVRRQLRKPSFNDRR